MNSHRYNNKQSVGGRSNDHCRLHVVTVNQLAVTRPTIQISWNGFGMFKSIQGITCINCGPFHPFHST